MIMDISVAKRDESTLGIKFMIYYKEGIEKIKNIPGRKWIPEESIWSIPYTIESVETLLSVFHHCRFHIESQLLEECYLLQSRRTSEKTTQFPDILSFHQLHWNNDQEQKLKKELILRGYSSKTIKAYCNQVKRFINFSCDQQGLVSAPLIQNYSLTLLNRNCSHAYVNQAISAIKFYMQTVLHQKDESPYIRPKKENKLPNVLSIHEVKKILNGTHNLKHKAILYLTYSSGLRVGEVVRLRLQDLDKERKTLRIQQGKGRKDRFTLLSENAYEMVQQYVKQEKPELWLFPGQT